MEITRQAGAKNEYGNDMVIEVQTNGRERITNLDVLKLVKMFFDNEEEIYPKSKGFQGGDKFRNAIFQMLSHNGMTPEQCAEIANKKGVYKTNFGTFNPDKWARVSCDQCGGDVICEACHNKYVWANKDDINNRCKEGEKK